MSETIRTLDVTQTHQLLSYLALKPKTEKQARRALRNYLATCLMLEAGLRVGETVGLIWDDLIFSGNVKTSIVVRPAIAKNHKERIVPISTRLHDAINEYYTRKFFKSTELHHPGEWLPGIRVIQSTTRQLERILKAAGMAVLGFPVNPHMLRHTFATRLMRQVDTRIVQQLLGHASITSTQIYTHPNSVDLKQAIEKVENAESDEQFEAEDLRIPSDAGYSSNARATDPDKR